MNYAKLVKTAVAIQRKFSQFSLQDDEPVGETPEQKAQREREKMRSEQSTTQYLTKVRVMLDRLMSLEIPDIKFRPDMYSAMLTCNSELSSIVAIDVNNEQVIEIIRQYANVAKMIGQKFYNDPNMNETHKRQVEKMRNELLQTVAMYEAYDATEVGGKRAAMLDKHLKAFVSSFNKLYDEFVNFGTI